MANTERRPQDDRNNKMFFPRTLDGAGGSDKFLTGTKMFIMLATFIVALLAIMNVVVGYASAVFKVVFTLVVLYAALWVIRMFVLEEKYYYAKYKEMKALQRSTPGLFWDIIRQIDTPKGCVVLFSNLNAGVYVRLTRGCTIGKEAEFRENHYDAISDFYNALNSRDFKFKKADIMETASKDERVSELDYLVRGSEFNENLNKLTQLKVGKLKNTARVTTVEEEYLLIYQDMYTDADEIINKIYDCLYELLEGGYAGFTILDSEDIDDLVKYMTGVKIFDSVSATLEVYRGNSNKKAFDIHSVAYVDGRVKSYKSIEEEEKAAKLAVQKTVSSVNNVETNKKGLRERLKDKEVSKEDLKKMGYGKTDKEKGKNKKDVHTKLEKGKNEKGKNESKNELIDSNTDQQENDTLLDVELTEDFIAEMFGENKEV